MKKVNIKLKTISNITIKLKVKKKPKGKRDQEIIKKYIADPKIRKKLIDIGGENVLYILKNFKSPVNEEELAKKIDIKVNDVRTTLNKLHGEGIVNYTKERDPKTGWFIYSWYFNAKRFEEWVEKNINEHELEEDKEYYYCPICKTKPIVFEEAAEMEFRCVSCGNLLEYYEKGKNE